MYNQFHTKPEMVKQYRAPHTNTWCQN